MKLCGYLVCAIVQQGQSVWLVSLSVCHFLGFLQVYGTFKGKFNSCLIDQCKNRAADARQIPATTHKLLKLHFLFCRRLTGTYVGGSMWTENAAGGWTFQCSFSRHQYATLTKNYYNTFKEGAHKSCHLDGGETFKGSFNSQYEKLTKTFQKSFRKLLESAATCLHEKQEHQRQRLQTDACRKAKKRRLETHEQTQACLKKQADLQRLKRQKESLRRSQQDKCRKLHT